MPKQEIVEKEYDPNHGFHPAKVNILRNTICSELSNDELEFFLYNCARSRLDPMTRQIYALKHSKNDSVKIMASIDGLRLIADRTGQYAPGKPTTYLYDENNNLKGAIAYVKKLTADGTWHEVSEIAIFKECDKRTFAWKTMPHLMIAKVAESRALRRAFPNDLSGIYEEDEFDQEKNILKTDKKERVEKTQEIEQVEVEVVNKSTCEQPKEKRVAMASEADKTKLKHLLYIASKENRERAILGVVKTQTGNMNIKSAEGQEINYDNLTESLCNSVIKFLNNPTPKVVKKKEVA